MPSNNDPRSVIDLFAGPIPGGWDLGARALGLDPVGLELDDAACATRRAAGLRTMQCDVAAVDFDCGWLGQRRYGLIASPPCQAFSMAGKGAGREAIGVYLDAVQQTMEGKPPSREELDEECDDERAHLVLEPLRWALALRPRWIALEQVRPVLPIWEAIATALRSVGYTADVGVRSFERYGVPQTRARALLIASLDGPVTLPPATHQRYLPPRTDDDGLFALSSLRRVHRDDRHLPPWVSMAEALGWGMTERPAVTVAAKPSETGGNRGLAAGTGATATIDGERERGAWLEHTQRDGSTGEYARRSLDEPAFTVAGNSDRWMIHGLRQSNRTNATVRRVSEPAPTMFFGRSCNEVTWVFDRPATSLNGDPRVAEPGRHDPDLSGSQYGSGTVRVSVEQAATLQTFPAGYPWQGTRGQQFTQVGNAVPPLAAFHILQAVTGLQAVGEGLADAA
jgi:DNA (cytosine-5)-methyltransferase 1